MTPREGGTYTALELIGGCLPCFRYAPRSLGATLFPYHMVISTNAASPFDFAFAVHHEVTHMVTLQKLGHWEFYRRLDLLAKLLLEIVGEQGSDPHGFAGRAYEIWSRLAALDEYGRLVEEAMALFPLLDDELGAEIWQAWQNDPMFVEHRDSLPAALQSDSSESEFLQRVQRLREALRAGNSHTASGGSRVPRDIHSEAFGLLEKLSLGANANVALMQDLLYLVNSLPLAGEELLSLNSEQLRGRWSEAPEIESRDGRLKLLASDPRSYLWDHASAYGLLSLRRDWPTFEQLLDWVQIPEQYLPVLQERYMNRSASQPAVLRNPEEGASWHANKTAARLLGGESQNGGVMQLSIIPKSLEEAGVKAFVEDQAFLVDCYTHLMLYAGAAGAQGVSEEYRSTMRILQPLGRAYETGPECEEHARRRLVAAGLEMHFLELLGRPGRPKPSKLMQIGFWTAVDTFRRTAPSVDLHQPVKEAQELILRRIEQLLGHTNPTKRKGETGKPEENRDQ